ncbi:MAG TPA: BamA/TamA family outer membrane protein [Polyangiales bacterium]|nr:BamA/TamA family outer membrane protein [Polyangiales bacterium]
MPTRTLRAFGLCCLLALTAPAAAQEDPVAEEEPADKKPGDDGWPDISSFLDQKFGFLPIVVPITEPAVGYGAAFGAAFLSKPFGAARQGLGRPNVTFVGGMATENGSWGAFAADMRYWLDDRLQTLAGVIYADVNLDFYGIGEDSVLADDPLRYTLNPVGIGLQAKYRVGDTNIWGGLSYAFAVMQVKFDPAANEAELPEFDETSRVAGLTLVASYDSRDNLFTPLRGTFAELSFGFFGKYLGGEDNFERLGLVAIQYIPLPFNLYFGARGDFSASFGNAPFYLQPYVDLRGIPVMRHQGEEVAQLDTELRWQFWGRLSVLAFIGVGGAWNDFEHVDNFTGIVAGGPGIRYELAREYGIHMGIDVGFSRDATAFYIQVGNAWFRP